MARLCAGDPDAAAHILGRFTNRLIELARANLDSRVRQKVDPEDILQSVYKSFFLRHATGQLSFSGWDGLWALLALITTRKCGRWARMFHSAKREVDIEVPASDRSALAQLFSDEPSPEEAAMLAEEVEQLLRELGKRDGEILTLALQGYTPAEISAQLHRPGRTVYRVLERIRVKLEAASAEGGAAS
jgi:RNA polymerase sigma-70 factor (ECF subfamily)